MRDFTSRLKTIQAAAGGNPAEQTSLIPDASSSPAVAPEPVGQKAQSWPRSEIIAALEKGATSYALTLSLQALSLLANDPSFDAEAGRLVKPAQTGEEWKRAFKTYSRYAEQIAEAGRKQDADAACELFSRAAQEVGDIYSSIAPGDPMAEQLALAVYEALSRLFDAGKVS